MSDDNTLPTTAAAPGHVSRRALLGGAGLLAAGVAATTYAGRPAYAAPPDDAVPLHWLDGVPATTTGATWGVPWPQGQHERDTTFRLTTSAGTEIPVQSWPLAYWPDGTVKWTGHAVGADSGLSEKLQLRAGRPKAPAHRVTVTRRGQDIVLDNGVITVKVAQDGTELVRSVTRAGRVTGSNGKLVLRLQDQPDHQAAEVRRTSWTGVVDSAQIEQSGPVRGVVKITGHYAIDRGQPNQGHGRRRLLPWTVRIHLSAEDDAFRLVHSFVWNADAERDFVTGLGFTMSVPLTDPTYNRHIRFSGSGRGVWGEPVRVLTGLRREPGAAVDTAQVAGTATPPPSQWASSVRDAYQKLAQWGDFSLVQNSAEHFSVWKRTSAKACWLKDAGAGDHASGFGYVGGVSGGLGFGLRDFWQQHPRALDIRDASTDTATVTLWSWSPHGDPMDLRPYDSAGHGLDLAYEDTRAGWGVPTGIARSTDIRIWAFDATPSRDRIADLAGTLEAPPQIVAEPTTYHGAGVFGRWSLPDRSSATRKAYEDSITDTIDFYAQQVEERQWYGFWNYGDVMHAYDADRHSWRYDVGGYAWDNAELGSDAMLWYAFLRSGRPKTFRLATAMTRHVAESDTYHAGPYAGLGSRHNVLHWGDGAKEPRVSEAYTKRFMYYLTADELIGDYLRVPLQLDKTLLANPPLRDIVPTPDGVPSMIRIGPDWYALVSNWLTEWERTGDTTWRDKITTGMRDIAELPAGLFTGNYGGAVGFDPKTGHISNLHSDHDYRGGYNLSMAFCGDQIMFETVGLVDVPTFRDTLLEFARYVQAPASEQKAHFGFSFNPRVFKTIYSRVTAWAGEQLDEADVQKRGWQELLDDSGGQPWPAPVEVSGTAVVQPVHEIPIGDFYTNDAAQRALAYIALLAVAPDQAP